MQYFNLLKYAKAFRVLKTKSIFAISYDDAKESNLLDKNNNYSYKNTTIPVRKNMMICKDHDDNIWTETKKFFAKRYHKVEKLKNSIWSLYKPTKHAINFAEKKSNNTYQMHELQNKSKTWSVTEEEFSKNYKRL